MMYMISDAKCGSFHLRYSNTRTHPHASVSVRCAWRSCHVRRHTRYIHPKQMRARWQLLSMDPGHWHLEQPSSSQTDSAIYLVARIVTIQLKLAGSAERAFAAVAMNPITCAYMTIIRDSAREPSSSSSRARAAALAWGKNRLYQI
eukprot:SAG11_NODE_9806_length_879_cov_1.434615_1_plen_146_part_00